MTQGLELATAYVSIVPSARGFEQQLSKSLDGPLQRAASQSGDKVAKTLAQKLNGASASLLKAGGRATLGLTTPIAGAFGVAIKSASDLNETISKSRVVFGESSKGLEAWASNAARDLGQSKQQALDAAGTFGNLFVALKIGQKPAAEMSRKLVGLASDLASFNNVDPAEALEALRSGLVGETEPLRKFGVNMDDASLHVEAVKLGLISTVKDALTPAAKAQAAYALILEQTTTAQGDFARTSDGLANKSRIMRAELDDAVATMGTKLLPTMLRVATAGEHLLSGFAALPAGTQNMALFGAAALAAAGPVSSVVGGVTGLLGQLAKLREGTGIVSGLASGFTVLGAAAAGTFALGQAVTYLQEQLDERKRGKADVDALTESILNLNNVGLDKLAKQARVNLDDVSTGFKLVNGDLKDLDASYQRFGERTGKKIGTNLLKKQFDDLDKSLAQLAASGNAKAADDLINRIAADLGKTPKDILPFFDDYQKALQSSRTQQALATGAQKDAAVATDDQASALTGLEKQLQSNEEKLKSFTSALDAAFGQTDVVEASIRFQQSQADLATAIAENGKGMDLMTEAGRKVAGAFDSVIQSARGEVDALVASGQVTAGTKKEQDELIRRLDDVKKKFPELAPEIDKYIWKLGEVQPVVATEVKVDVEPAILDVKRFKKELATLPKSAFLEPGFDPNQLIADATVPHRAFGGHVWGGQPQVVGDRLGMGSAEVFVPDRSGTIVPSVAQYLRSADLQPASSAGGLHVPPITVYSTDPVESAVEMVQRMRALVYLNGG